MAHSVEIDDVRWAAERAALMPDAEPSGERKVLPPHESGGGDEIPMGAQEEWRGAIEWVLPMAHAFICPNWELSGKGRELMIDGWSEQFAELFPDGFDIDWDNVPPWVKMAGGLGMVAFANFDMEHMKIKPLREPAIEGQAETEQQQQQPAAANDSQQAPGSFSTG